MLSEKHRLVSDGVHATVIDITDKLELQEQATRKEIAEWFNSPCENCDHEAYYINGYSRGHCDICLDAGLNELAQGLELP